MTLLFLRERQFDIGVINSLEPYKSREHFFCCFIGCHLRSIKDNFRAIDGKAIFKFRAVYFTGRSVFCLLCRSRVRLVLVSVIKELFDSLFDSGDFLLFSTLKEFFGHFDLNIKQREVVFFKWRGKVFFFDRGSEGGIFLEVHKLKLVYF